jgi:hypothetical protein
MDARTPDKHKPMAEGDTAAPAFMVRTAAQVGRDRTMEITFGVPMDMTPTDMHKYTDKVMSVIERQNNKGLLRECEMALDGHTKNLATNLEQKAALESKYQLDFVVSGRKGEFKAAGNQKAQLDNFDSTSKNLREVVIPKLKRDIEELKRKIEDV